MPNPSEINEKLSKYFKMPFKFLGYAFQNPSKSLPKLFEIHEKRTKSIGNPLSIDDILYQSPKTNSFQNRSNSLPDPLEFYWKSNKPLPNPHQIFEKSINSFPNKLEINKIPHQILSNSVGNP